MHCYSYIRFSSKQQAAGHSLSRQLERAREYARQHRLTLDERSYRDLGISAFKGKNAVEGALGAFLKAIDDGLIELPAVLLVESLDRISRTEVDEALELFLGIIRRGVTLITLIDGQRYSKASIKENWTQLIVTLALFARAHEESATKSDRAKKVIAAARESGKKLKNCPKWLRLSDDGKHYEVIEHEAAIVRRAFELRANGIGAHRIGHALTTEFGVTTSTPQVAAMLKNPAVIGTKVSQAGYEPILDYYTPIISKTQYYAVQMLMGTQVSTRRGRKPNDEPNLFSGLVRCGKCGGRLRFQRPTANVSQPYFSCLNQAYKRGCDAKHINYNFFEKEMIGWLLLDQDDEIIPLFEPKKTPQRADIAAEIKALQEQQERLLDLVMNGSLANPAVASKKLNDVEAKLRELQAVPQFDPIEEDDRLPAEKAWTLAVKLEQLSYDDDPTEYHKARRELRIAFQTAIETIFIDPEVRVGDEYVCRVVINFVNDDGTAERTYTRPALNNVKGKLNGRQAA